MSVCGGGEPIGLYKIKNNKKKAHSSADETCALSDITISG